MEKNNTNPGTIQKRPGHFLKMFLRFPVFLHQIGFGGWEQLLGMQWMFITTIGRKTGKQRYAMVDVIDYDKERDIYYIEVAYGQRADWFQNIQANPIFHAQVGKRQFKASATMLSTEQSGNAIVAFANRHPHYSRTVMAMVGIKFDDDDELRLMAREWIFLAVQPENNNNV